MPVPHRNARFMEVIVVALALIPGTSRGQQSASESTDPCVTLHLINPQDTDPAIGPGALASHLVWINGCVESNRKLLVFLPGATLTPAAYQRVQQVAAAAGYHVIGLMYANDVQLASACTAPGIVTDACFEAARLQILDGIDRSTVVQVDVPNSIDNRLTKLLLYLENAYPEEGWARFLRSGTPRWSQIAVSGHSQGGGEAAMIAKLSVTARVVLFSAPPDNTGAKPPVAATWEADHATPSSRYWGLAHDRDQTYGAILAGWEALAMVQFGALVAPEANQPPYGFTHTLVTDLLPQGGTYTGRAHGSTAVDALTPLASDGTPLLADAWRYLLTADDDN